MTGLLILLLTLVVTATDSYYAELHDQFHAVRICTQHVHEYRVAAG